MKKVEVGGQAVIEGVMMRSPKSFAVVCRRANGSLVIKRSMTISYARRVNVTNHRQANGRLTNHASPPRTAPERSTDTFLGSLPIRWPILRPLSKLFVWPGLG